MTVLWHTVFANPRPDVEVASLEVCSLLSKVRYTLAGLTVETGPARASERPNDSGPMRPVVEPSVVHFRLVDADDGSPVIHARVQASMTNKGQTAVWDIVETDVTGTAVLDFPSRDIPSQSEIVATGPNHVTTRFSLTIDPRRINLLKMNRGQKIGGKFWMRMIDRFRGQRSPSPARRPTLRVRFMSRDGPMRSPIPMEPGPWLVLREIFRNLSLPFTIQNFFPR